MFADSAMTATPRAAGTPITPMRIPVVYIAGPYRAKSRAGVELNIQSARAMGMQTVRKGWSPLIPHANTGGLDEAAPDIPDDYWLAATMELMRRCDAVLLCPGYHTSAGTEAEVAEAARLGIPVYRSPRELPSAKNWTSIRLHDR
ncbi:DUF4406 domain-containing protein [Pseudomonas sp. gcc21]|uniref:DUF7768 domain-containing protein n=1 Tax=Pseudomonas sp. gcc21 TaxID=2726989 RepID=UPI00145266B3|nr:DUF4406 domain-containing protein [Pseudomonas sp. gcc21]QJD58165.1 DUF4406 domain-containing protein [Pseudomonas sp. gcc21]